MPAKLTLSLLLCGFTSLVMAQLQGAHCNSTTGFGWASNSLNQDPCTMAEYLSSACSGGVLLPIPPLVSPIQYYTGPNMGESQNSCLCSSVYYMVLQACALCQNSIAKTWSYYKQNCSTVYLGVFVEGVPAGTRIPHWAYDNVTIYDAFNATVAKAESASPESTFTGSPTASVPASSSTSSSSHKSNAGAIAGGVIGALVFVALVVGGALWFIRRRRSAVSNTILDAPSPTFHGPSPVYTTPKLYDPSDPSTFPPSSPVTSSLYTSADQQHFGPQTQQLNPNGHYPGVAEI